MEAVFGIDLGTTNSCISLYANGRLEPLTIDGHPTVPSVIAWDGDQWLVGRRARNHLRIKPNEGVASVKRHMGDRDYRVQLGGRTLSAIEISSMILRYLRDEASKATGIEVRRVVITVPAWFTDEQRQATLAAGRLAELDILRIINEPTAASLAYDSSNEGHNTWLVYDLGGGTFDVSVVEAAGGLKEVKSTAGNTFLGGDDFDNQLALFFAEKIKDRYNEELSSDVVFMAKLRHIAEETKIFLSTESKVTVREIVVSGDKRLELEVTIAREEFESLIKDYIESTIAKCQQAIEEAGTPTETIDRVLLVGGSTRIPLVRQMVEDFTGKVPDAYIDPDLSVTLGAAVQAAIVSGLEVQQLVVDVCPHSLGTAALGSKDRPLELKFEEKVEVDGRSYPRSFFPLIRKNTRLPARFTKGFNKVHPEQAGAYVSVYQGESSISWDNSFVGSLYVPFETDSRGIDITFEYDANGVVQVIVKEEGATEGKRYTMDLGKSAEENIEKGTFTEVLEEKESSEIANYLVKKVESEITRRKTSSDDAVYRALKRYRELLALDQPDDKELEALEDTLHEWLEAEERA